MAFINKNYLNLKDSYLFSQISKKVQQAAAQNPKLPIIRLGIGDVTLPLAKCVVTALTQAAGEQASAQTFRGYGPEQGYEFLREVISEYYTKIDINLASSEIFISDGAKSDIANITDIFSDDNIIAIPDPVYPVYVDTNIMRGRKIVYIKSDESNNFLPLPDADLKCDIVYLCSPNNPTGAVYSAEQLKVWVDFARANNVVILFDAAYEAYIQDTSLPRSIYQVPGAKTCAIEFCSLSKTAGFTGTRCGYTIVPSELVIDGVSVNALWNRRQSTKFNGTPYIIQQAAAAVFTQEGQQQIHEQIDYYMQNARIIAQTLQEKGIKFTGGENSPYIWLKCPNNLTSWQFFDLLLDKLSIVGTPGAGFGENGEGYFRLTAFGSRENTVEAMRRINTML